MVYVKLVLGGVMFLFKLLLYRYNLVLRCKELCGLRVVMCIFFLDFKRSASFIASAFGTEISNSFSFV